MARKSFRPSALGLERRSLLSTATLGVEPTAEEQYMLQLVNRARSDPAAEARRLRTVARTDPATKSMVRSSDLAAFTRIMSRTPPRPPLAFDTRLIAAARTQAATMIATGDQRHAPRGFLHDASVAVAPDGEAYYPVDSGNWAVGENLYAYTGNVASAHLVDHIDYLHAGLTIDWGNPDFGHLRNLLAPGPGSARPGSVAYRDVGIGIGVTGGSDVAASPNPTNPRNAGLKVGPVVVAQEFGGRVNDPPRLVGAVYRDLDRDRFYTPGEGIEGVTVVAVGRRGEGIHQTQTWASGGYAMPLPSGTYVVALVSADPTLARFSTIRVGRDNVAWDVLAP